MPQTVLSVDGDAAVRSGRNEVLRAAGFEILEADTGADTLKLAFEHRPTLIVLAVDSSGADGFAVCKQLKADPRTASIPVLHISRTESRSGYLDSLESGAEGYLQEPVAPPVLVGASAALIRACSVRATTGKTERDASAKDALAALIESIPDEVWFANAQGRFTLANPSALREFKMGASALVDVEKLAKSLEILRADGTPRPVEEAPPLRALTGETVRSQEEIVRTPVHGELRYRQVSASPVRDAAGSIVGSVSVVRDITGQKRAEQALRASEERYRTLFETMTEGFALCEIICDERGRPRDYRRLAVNPAFERQTGITAGDALRQTPMETYPDAEPSWIETFGKVALTGEPARFEKWFEPTGQCFDVSAFQTEPGRFGAVFTDVTERKRREKQTEVHRQVLETVTTKLPAGVALIRGSDLRILLVNPAYQASAPGKDMIGRTIEEVWPETQPQFRERCLQVLATGETYNAFDEPFTIRRSRDSPFELTYWTWSLFRVRLPGDEGWGLMSVIIETTERKRVEDAHRESEAVLRSFFDSPGVMRGILELVDGRIFHVSCNKAAAEMYGVNPESVLGKSAPEVGTLEEAERMWTGLCEQSRIAGKPISIETAGRDASGLERWLLATCAYVGMGPSGNPRFAYTTFDFTERKRAEEALRESEKRFRALVTASSDVVYRVSPDWTEMRQLRGRDFLADTETPSRTWLHKYIHPDDQPRVLAAIEDAIRSKTVFELEHRVLRVDGTLGWTFSRAIPLLDSSGEIVEWLGAASDITERKRAEEALRESEERFRIMADGCPAIIWVTDAEGGNRFVNRAYHEFFGMMPEQVEGGKWQPLVHPDDAPLYMEAMVRAVRQRAPFRAEARVRRADGEWRWIASYGEPLLSASGEYLGHAGISPDITESKALADQLREQIEELETVMEVAPVAIWVAHDPPCQQITGNRMADRFYEAAAGENVSANVTAVRRFFQGGRELQPQELPMQEAAARGVDIRNSELEVLLPSGRLMNMLGNASPLRDAAGQVRGCVGTFLDITERKLAEGALRDSEERLRLTLDGTGLGTFEFRPETNESLWDAGAKAAWGLPAGAEITFPQVLEGIHPDDRSRVRATMEAALLAGSPESSEAEYRVIWPDGSVHWILGKSRTSFVGEGDQRRAVRMIGVHQDITARKRAEEALRESESRFRALLESAAQGVLAVDETGRILLVNARTEELFGYSRDELIGQPLEVLVPEDLQASHAGHKRQYFANPRTRQMGAGLDLRGIKKGGGDISLEISLSFVEEGGKRLALALITDVTERKRAEERLRQTQKLESLGLLAGGVAHDFNNLLVGVIGNASLAQEMLPPDHPAADLLHAVLKTGEQAAHLTRQMLAYSGKGKFVVEPLNLSALIPDMCGLVRPSISKKIALQFDLEKNLPAVEADRGQVQQVFMNLTLNAAEAIGDQEGLVTVRTGIQEVDGRYARLHQGTEALPPGKYVYLEVRDTGCGMDEATKAKVFDPFFSTKFMGRGLGLAAVSGILRGHKAAITVSSASGKGSCFTVLFPAAEGTAEKPVVGARAAAVHGAGVVLVVDDEQLIREMAKRALERHGYTVLLADSGPEAINIFKKDPAEISMVILDLSMPHMSGEEVLPELRKIRPKVKFLVSSGYSEAEAMTLFKGQRVSGFVQKPYTSNDLAEKVMECLG